MKIVFYGPLADTIAREIELTLDEGMQTLGTLRTHLAGMYPAQAETLCGPRTRWAVEGEFAADDAPLDRAALIECLPPVSGG